MGQYAAWDAESARQIILQTNHGPGALLPILRAVQEAFGHIPREAERMIADELNLSRAEVHGVISFYHDFRHDPPPRHMLRLCRAEACQSMGGDRLAARAKEKLGVEFGESTSEGRVALEPVYCLGLCATAPSAMLNGRVYGRLDDSKLDALLAETER